MVRSKVIAGSLGAAVASFVAVLYVVDPDTGRLADAFVSGLLGALGSFGAGYMKVERRNGPAGIE